MLSRIGTQTDKEKFCQFSVMTWGKSLVLIFKFSVLIFKDYRDQWGVSEQAGLSVIKQLQNERECVGGFNKLLDRDCDYFQEGEACKFFNGTVS
jgi:hypothetical protein